MNPDFSKFPEYMLAKDALNKIASSAMFGTEIELTQEECRALISQKVIDLQANVGMLT
jgi:hypothetical protein